MRMSFDKKMEIINEKKISFIGFPENAFTKRTPIRGVYGVFSGQNSGTMKCLYVGRSYDIIERFITNGHLTPILKNTLPHKVVSKLIKEELNKKKKIEIRLLKFVPYKFDNYYKDMQRLASAENKEIDCYQDKDECLNQIPEGTSMEKKKWEEMKLTQKIIQ